MSSPATSTLLFEVYKYHHEHMTIDHLEVHIDDNRQPTQGYRSDTKVSLSAPVTDLGIPSLLLIFKGVHHASTDLLIHQYRHDTPIDYFMRYRL
jgi:hypothetical protein